MGAREARGLALAVLLLACPAGARAENGQEAFARQDYVAAAELWREEAAAGSPEAKFGLGLIHDLGLGVPRSSAAALRWYLEAAGDGLADAQFNVAVMFDAGTGMARDPAAAATWYARAAANGHARAQYNLAMLYQNGTGVPRNDDLARVWYEKASSTLAAAADRLAELPEQPEPRFGGPPPQMVAGTVVGPRDALRAELVWTAEPGDVEFRIQIARQPSRGVDALDRDHILLEEDVQGSSVALDLPAGTADLIWRVGRTRRSGDGMTWSSWGELPRPEAPVADEAPPLTADAGAGADEPSERLTIYVNGGDDLARSFAEELSASFARGGVAVTVRSATEPAATTTVEYHDPGDAAFAASVAGFLPALRPDSLVLATDVADATNGATIAGRGEVTLRLVGGPRPSRAPEG